MGQARSKIVRYARRFNVENRAHKAIDRTQTVAEPAPKHASTIKSFSKFRAENPDYLEAVSTKNEELHEQLKSVYLQSQGDNHMIQTKSKPLKTTKMKKVTEYGIMDIEYKVPEGKTQLRTAIEFISKHHQNPQNMTVEKICEENNLNHTDVENVLQYFNVLHIHLPKVYEEDKDMQKAIQQQMDSGGKYAQAFQLPDLKKKKATEIGAGSDTDLQKT